MMSTQMHNNNNNYRHLIQFNPSNLCRRRIDAEKAFMTPVRDLLHCCRHPHFIRHLTIRHFRLLFHFFFFWRAHFVNRFESATIHQPHHIHPKMLPPPSVGLHRTEGVQSITLIIITYVMIILYMYIYLSEIVIYPHHHMHYYLICSSTGSMRFAMVFLQFVDSENRLHMPTAGRGLYLHCKIMLFGVFLIHTTFRSSVVWYIIMFKCYAMRGM